MLGSIATLRLLVLFLRVSKPYRYARKEYIRQDDYDAAKTFQNLIGMLGRENELGEKRIDVPCFKTL